MNINNKKIKKKNVKKCNYLKKIIIAKKLVK
jgi:hypothetical protein